MAGSTGRKTAKTEKGGTGTDHSGTADFLYSQDVWKYDLDILPGASNISEYLPIIKDKKVCILSNQTGIIPAIDLSDKKNCKWYCLCGR